MIDAVVRAPDHLGDAVMALGAITALAGLGRLRVYTRGGWGPALYAGFDVRSGEEVPEAADVAVCLKPSWHAAYRWRHLPTVGVGPRWRYTTALPEQVEHRRERYARLVRAAGAPVPGPSCYLPRGVAPPLPERFVAINPWSPTATVRWPGFGELARALAPIPVVAFCGPAEAPDVRRLLGDGVPLVAGLALPDFAAALAGCAVFVSNDSGAAHFAAACGAPVVMVHGSTAPELTGAGTGVERPERRWCQPCYHKRCPWGLACLDVAIAPVEAAVRSHWDGGRAPRNAPPSGGGPASG